MKVAHEQHFIGRPDTGTQYRPTLTPRCRDFVLPFQDNIFVPAQEGIEKKLPVNPLEIILIRC